MTPKACIRCGGTVTLKGRPLEGLYCSPMCHQAATASRALERAVRLARERYDALSPEQKAEHDRKQRESFVRGMMPTGDPRFD